MKLFLKKKPKDINIFFCFLSNTIYLNRRRVWVKTVLPIETFCALNLLDTKPTFIIKLFMARGRFWEIFWKIANLGINLETGFYSELELIGLGFRIKKISSNVYRFFWGHSNFVYLFVPTDLSVEYSPEERLIFFFGVSANVVNNFSSYLLLLKKLSVYRVTGLVKPGTVIRLNFGKQR